MIKSTWEHLICEECWHEVRGTMYPYGTAKPVNLLPCCHCGARIREGVWSTDDPELVRCRGKGPVHKQPKGRRNREQK